MEVVEKNVIEVTVYKLVDQVKHAMLQPKFLTIHYYNKIVFLK